MIRVLIVEDEAVAARAHAVYVGRLEGFSVAGVVGTAAEAAEMLDEAGPDDPEPIDLVLLDLHLPDLAGLELLRRLRAAGSTVDVIVVSSARDSDIVRAAVTQGAMQYLIKPFTFAAFRDKLSAYRAFQARVAGAEGEVEQVDVDNAFAVLRSPTVASLPKGMTKQTLGLVTKVLRDRTETSAGEIAAELGMSRITAGRYLGYLVEVGTARRGHRYGQVGRPVAWYRMVE